MITKLLGVTLALMFAFASFGAPTAHASHISPGAYATTTRSVNMRTGPSTEYRVKRVLPDGARVYVRSGPRNGVWYLVRYEGVSGYVHGTYLTQSANSGVGSGYQAAMRRMLPGGRIISGWCVSSSCGRIHHGVDVQAAMGSRVYAIERGTITYVAYNSSAGYMVAMRDEKGRLQYFAHFDRPSSHLWAGKRVSRGSLIGHVGMTGNARGTVPHVHFQITYAGAPSNSNRYAVNPASALANWNR